MKVVIQRVKQAQVEVDKKIVGKINKGLLIFLAIHKDDTEESLEKLVLKIKNLRIFADQAGKMNLSLSDVDGSLLVVSQFTLYGNCQKGNRPGFSDSAEPKKALSFYEKFILRLKAENLKVESGVFGAIMSVELINDGPVTFIIDM